MEIKSNEWYENFAKSFAQSQWGIDLNIPVKFNNRLKSVSGRFRFKRKNFEPVLENRPMDIQLAPQIVKNHDEMVGVLKHELCHWYCFISGLDYGDGDKDFEMELKKAGTFSTYFGYNDKERSSFIQDSTASNKMRNGRLTDVKVKKLDTSEMYRLAEQYNHSIVDIHWVSKTSFSSSYAIYYQNELVGYTFNIHSKQWCTLIPSRKVQSIMHYETRKLAIQEMVFEYLKQPA